MSAEERLKFQQEMKKNCKPLNILPDKTNENNDGEITVKVSYFYDKFHFLKLFETLEIENQFQYIHHLEGFRSQIYHTEDNEINYMYGILFQGEEKLEESPLFCESKIYICKKRVEKWMIRKFLEFIKSESFHVKFYISSAAKIPKELVQNIITSEEIENQMNQKKEEKIKYESSLKKMEELIESRNQDLQKINEDIKIKEMIIEETNSLKNAQIITQNDQKEGEEKYVSNLKNLDELIESRNKELQKINENIRIKEVIIEEENSRKKELSIAQNERDQMRKKLEEITEDYKKLQIESKSIEDKEKIDLEKKLKNAEDEYTKLELKIQEMEKKSNQRIRQADYPKEHMIEQEQDKLKLEKTLKETQDLLQKIRNEAEEKEKQTVQRLNALNKYFQMKTGELKFLSKKNISKVHAKFRRCSKKHPSFLYIDEEKQPLYYVEDVLSYKRIDGKDLYEVKWYGARENTWEPGENLKNISRNLLAKVRKEKKLHFENKKIMKKLNN